jgi:hypothetical protein
MYRSPIAERVCRKSESSSGRARHKINWQKSAPDNLTRVGLNGTRKYVIIQYRFSINLSPKTLS